MTALDVELGAYRQQAGHLEAAHAGKWVVFKDSNLVAIHSTFDEAAADAVSRFGRGPYLIRQVGAPAIVMPVSLAYNPEDENH